MATNPIGLNSVELSTYVSSTRASPTRPHEKEEKGEGFLGSSFCQAVVEGANIGANECQLNQINQVCPFLNVLVAPIYLSNAYTSCKSSFGSMKQAIKTKRASDIFFYGALGVNYLGEAIGGLGKVFCGGVKVLGVAESVTTGLFFTLILPIILIVTSVIGLVSFFQLMTRAVDAREDLEEKIKAARDNLQKRIELLMELGGEKGSDELTQLRMKNFQQTHFSSEERFDVFKEEVLKLNPEQIYDKLAALRDEIRVKNPDLIESIEKSQREGSLEGLVAVLAQLEGKLQSPLKDQVSECRKLLTQIKERGDEIFFAAKEENKRVVSKTTFYLALSLIVLVAALLYLPGVNEDYFATLISVMSSSLMILFLLYDWKIPSSILFDAHGHNNEKCFCGVRNDTGVKSIGEGEGDGLIFGMSEHI